MRFFIIILLTVLLSESMGRPSRMEEGRNNGETEESDYDDNEETGIEEPAVEDDDAQLNDEEKYEESRTYEIAKNEHISHADKEDMRRSPMERHAGKDSNNSDFPENIRRRYQNEITDNVAALNPDYSYQEQRQSSRTADGANNEMIDVSQREEHLSNSRNPSHLQSEPQDNEDKRTVENQLSELNIANINNERNSAVKNKYSNKVLDTIEPSRYFRHYFNQMQPDKPVTNNRANEYVKIDVNRKRRQAEKTDNLNLFKSPENHLLSDTANEDDEAAIKRHIKKLSHKELEELLNSLSEDKKALLNKIMEEDHGFEILSKREITKKANAVDENNVENNLSELSKLQIGSSLDSSNDAPNVTEITSPKYDVQAESEATKSNSVKMDSENTKADLSVQAGDNSNNLKSDTNYKFDSKTQNPTEKTEIKREIKINHDDKYSDDYIDGHTQTIQDDNSFQSQDDEAESQNKKYFKRESQNDLEESIRSLEESFPNSDYKESGQYFETNMVPLVRVKRTNTDSVVKKRAAGILPDAKVAFFPYENDDEDNDEGSEFDDDGFYDRSANYAQNNKNKISDIVPLANQAVHSKDTRLQNIKENCDTMSLGSDTDNVLSGVEGVDDNLMYNSSNRNKRARSTNLEELTELESDQRIRSTALAEETTKSEAFINVLNYQENDGFGALPRNYEGELGRYKRIRRVKPPSSSST